MNDLINIHGVRGRLTEDGTAELNLEDVSRGLGFIKRESKNGTLYERINKQALTGWLVEFGILNSESTVLPDYIPENIFYKLCFKASNEAARAFQDTVTDEVLPSIRKHGAYMTPETLEAALLNPDTLIKLATALKDEQTRNKQLQAVNSTLTVDNTIMKPKADYFDELVDRNLLLNFRDTAKELHIGQNEFVSFLLERKYVYRTGKKGKLMPYAQYADSGLFEVKEQVNEKTGWSGTQTLITPKGRETFRLLCIGAKAA